MVKSSSSIWQQAPRRVKSKDSDCEESDGSSEATAVKAKSVSAMEEKVMLLRLENETLRAELKQLRSTQEDEEELQRARLLSHNDASGDRDSNGDLDNHSSSRGLHHRGAHSTPAILSDSVKSDEEVGLILSTKSHDEADETILGQIKDRAAWLVGLLCLQSLSSFIISRNESLLQEHIVIVQFLVRCSSCHRLSCVASL